MATEDFTTYTEVDPNSRIVVATRRIAWTLLQEDEDAYVYKDKGAAFFDGDFSHKLTVRATGGTHGAHLRYWTLANLVDDFWGIVSANGDALSLGLSFSASQFRLNFGEVDGGTQYTDVAYSIDVDTDYFVTIVRDESVGTYGTFYAYIYSDSARTILLNTQSITLHSSKKDYRYLYICHSNNNGGTAPISGYVEDLDLSAVVAVAPTVTTQAVSNIGETTATANGNITDLGSPNPTAHGFAYSPSDTTPDIETDSVTDEGAASSTGAFTSDLTGLTAGLLYYVRAYATNTAGTSYGAVVTVRGIRAVGAGYVWQDGPFVHFGGEDGNEVIYNPPLTVSGSEDPGYLWTEGTELNVIDSAGDERSEEGTATGDTGPEGTAFIEASELHYLDAAAGAERTH